MKCFIDEDYIWERVIKLGFMMFLNIFYNSDEKRRVGFKQNSSVVVDNHNQEGDRYVQSRNKDEVTLRYKF